MRLGNIRYSNCFPVHARLIDRPEKGDPALVEGVPSELNRLLAGNEIDVAPSSSIEYALHADRYRILPDLVIGSRGAVRSIMLLSSRPPAELNGCVVGIPTASATSVVLLKILMFQRWGARPNYRWFDQATEDPIASGADAALFIGDVALRPDLHADLPIRIDLGAEWWKETGLPFAFAIWQVSAQGRDAELRKLHRQLLESREYGEAERPALAERYASRFRMPAAVLHDYWSDLSFHLDAAMAEGLTAFYRLAVEIGEVPRVPEMRWVA